MELGDLSNLEFLGLDSNRLSGVIPDRIGQFDQSHLPESWRQSIEWRDSNRIGQSDKPHGGTGSWPESI